MFSGTQLQVPAPAFFVLTANTVSPVDGWRRNPPCYSTKTPALLQKMPRLLAITSRINVTSFTRRKIPPQPPRSVLRFFFSYRTVIEGLFYSWGTSPGAQTPTMVLCTWYGNHERSLAASGLRIGSSSDCTALPSCFMQGWKISE